MDKNFRTLFAEVSHAAELLAERVMDYNHTLKDTKGENTAKTMRDDYNHLYEKIQADNFNDETLAKEDYAKLLVAVLIVINNLQDQIKNLQNTINGYKKNIVPRLQRIVDEARTTEEAQALSTELFKSLEEFNA